jgi:hypothetical protein
VIILDVVVREALRALLGNYGTSLKESGRLASLLGSREELAAWLLLRSGFKGNNSLDALRSAATSAVVSPGTRRAVHDVADEVGSAAVQLEHVMKKFVRQAEVGSDSAQELEGALRRYGGVAPDAVFLGLRLVR